MSSVSPHRSFLSQTSPPARGRADVARGRALLEEAIPACAGKRASATVVVVHDRGHPRSRGGEEMIGSLPASLQGSSPLARGRGMRNVAVSYTFRAIPARAGESSKIFPGPIGGRGQPRSRGGEEQCNHDQYVLIGSSPLARGRDGSGAPADAGPGVIPARAGERSNVIMINMCL